MKHVPHCHHSENMSATQGKEDEYAVVFTMLSSIISGI